MTLWMKLLMGVATTVGVVYLYYTGDQTGRHFRIPV